MGATMFFIRFWGGIFLRCWVYLHLMIPLLFLRGFLMVCIDPDEVIEDSPFLAMGFYGFMLCLVMSCFASVV